MVSQGGQDFPSGQNGHRLRLFTGALRASVEPANGVHLRTPKLDTHRFEVACWEHVDDAAATAHRTRALHHRFKAVTHPRPLQEQWLKGQLLTAPDNVGQITHQLWREGALHEPCR